MFLPCPKPWFYECPSLLCLPSCLHLPDSTAVVLNFSLWSPPKMPVPLIFHSYSWHCNSIRLKGNGESGLPVFLPQIPRNKQKLFFLGPMDIVCNSWRWINSYSIKEASGLFWGQGLKGVTENVFMSIPSLGTQNSFRQKCCVVWVCYLCMHGTIYF